MSACQFLKTAVVGLVAGVLFVWMRSVWGVVVLHTTIDICSGVILRRISQEPEPVPEP